MNKTKTTRPKWHSWLFVAMVVVGGIAGYFTYQAIQMAKNNGGDQVESTDHGNEAD